MKHVWSAALITAIAGSASANEVTVDNCGEPLVFEFSPNGWSCMT